MQKWIFPLFLTISFHVIVFWIPIQNWQTKHKNIQLKIISFSKLSSTITKDHPSKNTPQKPINTPQKPIKKQARAFRRIRKKKILALKKSLFSKSHLRLKKKKMSKQLTSKNVAMLSNFKANKDKTKEEKKPHIRRPLQKAKSPKKQKKVIDLRAYRSALTATIERYKHYPRLARRMGFEGIVFLLVKISSKGHLVGKPKILRSSGYKILDREALRMLLKASPFSVMPMGINKNFIQFKIPINFTLN